MNKYIEYKNKLKNYIDDISDLKPLDEDIEIYYFSILKTDIDLEKRNSIEEVLIKNYLKYIIKIVLSFSKHNYDYFDDLMIAGIDACLKAIKNFNYKLNYKFLSYATIWIKGDIINELKRLQDNKTDYDKDEAFLDSISSDNYEKLGDYKNVNFDQLLESKLTIKEISVIKSLYGYKCKKLTLEQIGINYHVTKQAIYKIKKRALNKLKESLK